MHLVDLLYKIYYDTRNCERQTVHVKLYEFIILKQSDNTIHVTPILPSRIYARIDIPKNKLTSYCESRLVCELVNRGLSQHYCRNLTRGTAGLHLLNAVHTKLLSHIRLPACVQFLLHWCRIN
jgi:hypothetical protein